MKKFGRVWVAVAALAFVLQPAAAQEVSLRVHHFMSANAVLHHQFLVPFGERLEAASDGRIAVDVFHSMSLGGRPGDLYEQAVDGAVDIALTLPGYTAGRFNRTEVFELPFIVSDTVVSSKSFWDLITSDLQDGEYRDAKILAGWTHSPGVLHSKVPIRRLEDMRGKEARGPTRVITDFLGEVGASPVGMPLPKIPENLSKGVINATLLPWEVTPSIRLAELVQNHTEFGGERVLYTATFILAMNWDAYDAMPADLRAIVDAESGKAMSEWAGQVMVAADAPGRNAAAGNNIIRLDAEETARWEAAAQPVYERWITRARDNGFDGTAAITQAKALMASNSK